MFNQFISTCYRTRDEADRKTKSKKKKQVKIGGHCSQTKCSVNFKAIANDVMGVVFNFIFNTPYKCSLAVSFPSLELSLLLLSVASVVAAPFSPPPLLSLLLISSPLLSFFSPGEKKKRHKGQQ